MTTEEEPDSEVVTDVLEIDTDVAPLFEPLEADSVKVPDIVRLNNPLTVYVSVDAGGDGVGEETSVFDKVAVASVRDDVTDVDRVAVNVCEILRLSRSQS